MEITKILEPAISKRWLESATRKGKALCSWKSFLMLQIWIQWMIADKEIMFKEMGNEII